MSESRLIVNVAAQPWIDAGYFHFKPLRMNDDGGYIAMIRGHDGLVAPSHVHPGPSDIYFLSGAVETAAGLATPGCWVREPAGALHAATTMFAGERNIGEVTGFTHANGPVVMLDESGMALSVLYGQLFGAIADVDGQMDLLDFTKVYRDDYDSGIVDPTTMPWEPTSHPGISTKVLKVDEGGSFIMLVHADDGAVLPPRRHTAPADFYVLSGTLQFNDDQAPTDHWVYQPMGAVEGEIHHVGETLYLATYTGAALELAHDGSVTAILDGSTVQTPVLI